MYAFFSVWSSSAGRVSYRSQSKLWAVLAIAGSASSALGQTVLPGYTPPSGLGVPKSDAFDSCGSGVDGNGKASEDTPKPPTDEDEACGDHGEPGGGGAGSTAGGDSPTSCGPGAAGSGWDLTAAPVLLEESLTMPGEDPVSMVTVDGGVCDGLSFVDWDGDGTFDPVISNIYGSATAITCGTTTIYEVAVGTGNGAMLCIFADGGSGVFATRGSATVYPLKSCSTASGNCIEPQPFNSGTCFAPILPTEVEFCDDSSGNLLGKDKLHALDLLCSESATPIYINAITHETELYVSGIASSEPTGGLGFVHSDSPGHTASLSTGGQIEIAASFRWVGEDVSGNDRWIPEDVSHYWYNTTSNQIEYVFDAESFRRYAKTHSGSILNETDPDVAKDFARIKYEYNGDRVSTITGRSGCGCTNGALSGSTTFAYTNYTTSLGSGETYGDWYNKTQRKVVATEPSGREITRFYNFAGLLTAKKVVGDLDGDGTDETLWWYFEYGTAGGTLGRLVHEAGPEAVSGYDPSTNRGHDLNHGGPDQVLLLLDRD